MTDNEIIKGLSCLSGNVIFCADCGYTNDGRCKEMCAKDALDLINRQKAEIESLNNQERILICQLAEEREKAIKEFAERLKDHLKEHAWIWCSEVDNLVKEMVGEDK